MPWVRFDDQFPIHRKPAGLSDAAFRLHVSAIFWSARNLTDGFVAAGDLDDVSARVRTPARFADECVTRECWHDARYNCASPKCAAPVDADGWVIHDYLMYQPSRQQVLADREAAAKRQKNWRDNKKRNAVTNGTSNSVMRNGVSNAPVTPLITATPPRPEGSGAGEPAPVRARTAPPATPGGRPDSRPASEVLALPPGHRPATPESRAAAVAAAKQGLARRKPP